MVRLVVAVVVLLLLQVLLLCCLQVLLLVVGSCARDPAQAWLLPHVPLQCTCLAFRVVD